MKVSDDSSYHSNEEKFVNIFNRLEQSSHEWYMFIDDDTWVNTKLLSERINLLNRSVVHGQKINCWPGDYSLYYLSGGAGILIHRDLYSAYRGRLNNYRSGYSDVSLGLFMRDQKIPCVNEDGFFSQPPSFYLKGGSEQEIVENSISFHYIKTEEEHRRLTELTI